MNPLKTLIFLLVIVFFIPQNLNAQQPPKEIQIHHGQRCIAHEHQQKLEQRDGQAIERRDRLETFTRNLVKRKNPFYDGQIITIPVVVHVVHFNEEENITDEQIHSQIDIINEDFRRLNADRNQTPDEFADVAADVQIEFCLASIDPNGYTTSGITRTRTYNDNFYIFGGQHDFVKFDATGGRDAWSTDEYLNMWVADLPFGLLGYATFPEGFSADEQGVVMTHTGFGNTGTASYPFDLGRTTTHEIGHYLNLRHIWGDGDCTVDDFVEDTPNASDPNYVGEPCSFPGRNSCDEGPGDLPDMFQNYMDYSDDHCMNLFTKGQKARMLALFESGGPRESLLYSNGCGQNNFGRGRRPTCSDGVRNGDETGVDCGGSCGDPCVPTSYCATTADLAFYGSIGSVSLGDYENISGPDGGYGDYSRVPINLEAGEAYPMSIAPSYDFGFPFLVSYKVYIDINSDYDFDDAGELIFASDAGIAPVSGFLEIPDDVYGQRRIRVVMSATDPTFFFEEPTACGIYLIGESEDYTINVANCRPPMNVTHLVTPSKAIELKWDRVPEAEYYVVAYSKDGVSHTVRTVKDGKRLEGLSYGHYTITVKTKCADGFSPKSYPISVRLGGQGGHRLTNSSLDNSFSEMQLHQVYPNPARQELYIQYSGVSNQPTTLRITDIFGKTIEQINNIDTEGKQVRRLDVSSLADGIYFVSLSSGVEVVTKRFVKQ